MAWLPKSHAQRQHPGRRPPQIDGRAPASQRGYDRRWLRIRTRYKRQHPLCEACKAVGRLVPATEVHHRTPLKDGGTHAQANLQSLCHACHQRTHRHA